jgi:hypothetical protein
MCVCSGTSALNMPACESLLPDPGTLCKGKPLRRRGTIHGSERVTVRVLIETVPNCECGEPTGS